MKEGTHPLVLNGLSRVYRYVPASTLPSGVMCTLDHLTNIQLINKEAFELLSSDLDRHHVMNCLVPQITFEQYDTATVVNRVKR